MARLKIHSPGRKDLAWIAVDLSVALGAFGTLDRLRFLPFALAVSLIGLTTFDACRRWYRSSRGGSPFLDRAALSLASVLVSLSLLEGLLGTERAARWLNGLTGVPEPLAWRWIDVPGAHAAFEWQGKVHVRDEQGMRRVGPVPARRCDRRRIAVYGDSMTYGLGVAEAETFPAVLQRLLGDSVEVLNLGICGFQSEDLASLMARSLAELDPDVVLYAAYINDFLPGARDHSRQRPFRSPVPAPRPGSLEQRCRLATLVTRALEKARMCTGLVPDAIENILVDFDARRQRFRDDVDAMNQRVREQGCAPMLAVVLNHWPRRGSRQNELAGIAEKELQESGARVLPMTGFLARIEGQDFRVSAWEPHASAEFHELFARELVPFVNAALGERPARTREGHRPPGASRRHRATDR